MHFSLDPLRKLGIHPLTPILEFFLRYSPLAIPVLDVVGFIYVIFSLDPTHFLVSVLFGVPNTNMFSFSGILLLVLRVIHTLSVFYIGFAIIIGTIIMSVFLLFMISCFFFHLKLWAAFISRMSEWHRIPTRPRLISLHAEMKLLEIISNEVGYVMFPFMLLCGLGIIVAANYATIRMHSIIPMPYYLSMPLGSLICVALVMVLMPPASDIHETSRGFLKQLVFLCSKNRYLLRKVKCQQAFRFNVGSMFAIKKATLTAFVSCVIELTVNSILLRP